MSLFKHTIDDESVRDVDTDNVLDETRVERKTLFGLCYWSKEAKDKSEYVKVEKRKLGF